MKILVVMGSPRKGNTYRAAERIREPTEAHGSIEFEYLWLKDANLLPSRGCFVCIEKGEEKCLARDDGPAIEQGTREADGVMLASPVFRKAFGRSCAGILRPSGRDASFNPLFQFDGLQSIKRESLCGVTIYHNACHPSPRSSLP